MPKEHPYPTPFEMLRFILRSLDLKLPAKDKKRLDDLATQRIYDPREFNQALAKYFTDVAVKYIGCEMTDLISNGTNQFIEDYLYNIAGKFPADGVSREFILKLLVRTTIKDQLVKFALALRDETGGPHPTFWFSSKSGTVDELFTWLSNNEPHWDAYLAALPKERRDMISAWRKGEDLASSQSLYLLSIAKIPNNNSINSLNWNRIKPLLFLARAIDFIKRNAHGHMLLNESRVAIWGVEPEIDIGKEIIFKKDALLKSLGPQADLVAELKHELTLAVKKTAPEQYRPIIQEARKLINGSKNLKNTEYWIDWHDARWHVFSGDLKTANNLYKSAFEKSAFVAGENQKYLAEEAIIVAASQKTPDKVFLKQLKWILIIFGYDIPSVTNSKPSQKVYDNIEKWEIDLWRSSFDRVFPEDGLFPGVEYKPYTKALGPLFFSEPSEVKPDYRHQNRTIKIGDAWQKAMPQLVWFALKEDVEVCRKLIEKGADVNVKSEVGDTPILMALQALNVDEIPWTSLNDDLFKLISRLEHTSEIMNTRTQKKRLLPIISAVQTGKADVVERILDMGADPNGRGLTDEQTALNVCLKLINKIKNPQKYIEGQKNMPITPEVLDSIRRHSNGSTGFTLDHLKQSTEEWEKHPKFCDYLNICQERHLKRLREKITIDDLRQIARILIEAGSNVNAEHSSPIKGFTPFMLAAELDEKELFKIMLENGGNLKKTYKQQETSRSISIPEIADYFNSRGVIQVLQNAAARK